LPLPAHHYFPPRRSSDLLEFLRRRRLDLLIEVRIRRNKSGSPGRSDGYSDPVSRIYLLRRSGRLETMAKSGRSRSVNRGGARGRDRKSTRLNSSHVKISY